jgi:signal transduction histidine kinase
VTAHVLFVDDEPPNLAVFEALCGADFSILTAGSATEALAVLASHEVGVLLSDQRMPETSGVDLLERVRSEFPDTVRMLVTAYADLGATIEAINRGHVRRYIRKPWDAEELKATLAEAMALYETRRGVQAVERRLIETERVYGLGIVATSLAQELRDPIATVSQQIKHARDTLRSALDATPSAATEVRAMRARIAQADEALVDAVSAADALTSLVRGIEIPTMPRDDGAIDMRNLVRLTLRILRSELRDAEARIELASVPNVRGSSAKLGQVVINLVVNAIRAVADRPRAERVIAVRLSTAEGWVVLEVEDNRAAPVTKAISRVFELLSKNEETLGTGLGLAISKRIAEELGGRIETETRDAGLTLFRLRVPVLD